MSHSDLLLPMVGLVAVQFLLYAAGWALAAWLLPRRQKAAALHWAGFMLLLGLGFWLASHRGEPRQWAAYAGSNIAFLSGYLLLWRGLEAFLDVPARWREQLAWGVLLVALFAPLGADPAHASLRTFLTYGLGALLYARLLVAVFRPMTVEFPGGVAYAIALPAFAMVLLLGARAVQQAAAWQLPLEMHVGSGGNIDLLYGY